VNISLDADNRRSGCTNIAAQAGKTRLHFVTQKA
jgi:hypothetical protein